MSESFRGEFSQKVDGKARVSIPAQFRRILEAGDPQWPENPRPKFVIVYGGDERQFLECYTISGMKRVERLIALEPRGTAKRRYLERNLITLSLTAEIDEDGRIVLPQKVRDKISIAPDDLKKGVDATFAGALDTFQIWRSDAYEADLLKQAAAAPDLLAPGQDMLALLPDDPEA